MDQLRNTLSENVTAASNSVNDAVSAVADKVGAAVPQAPSTEAADVRVETVEGEKSGDEATEA